MNIVVECVRAVTAATGAIIELVEGDDVVCRAASGSAAPYVNVRLKVSESLSGKCLQCGEILYSDDTSTDSRVSKEVCEKVKAVSMLLVPLLRRGQAVGVLTIVSSTPQAFYEEDVQTLELMAQLLERALGRQTEVAAQCLQTQNAVKQIPQYDALTGVAGRALFHERLSCAVARNIRSKRYLALLCMSIEHFKAINDTYGHQVGDALLKAFSKRISRVVRKSDTFARLGGDEFALIAEDLQNPYQAEIIAARFIKAMRPDFDVEGHNFCVGIHVGAIVVSDFGGSLDLLAQKGAEALDAARKEGRNSFYLSQLL